MTREVPVTWIRVSTVVAASLSAAFTTTPAYVPLDTEVSNHFLRSALFLTLHLHKRDVIGKLLSRTEVCVVWRVTQGYWQVQGFLKTKQDAVVDGGLRPPCRHLANWANHTRRLSFGLFRPLYENMTSSTKPEIHNELHRRQRKTEPHLNCHIRQHIQKIWWNLVVFEVYERKDKQTNKQTERQTRRLYCVEWTQCRALD